MKIKISLSMIFTIASGLVLVLGTYLIATKVTLHPQLFITTCGEILKNINQHVHFNPNGVVSSFVLLIAFIGTSMTVWRLKMFLSEHRRLNQLKTNDHIPKKLGRIVEKHQLEDGMISVIYDTRLVAYTVGLLKPKIVVSKALVNKLTEKQLEAVILHELYHLKSFHVFWLLISRLVSSMLFFVPLIDYLARQLQTEFELMADAFVIEKQKTRHYLCESLALHLQYTSKAVPNFATSPIEKRVESLVGDKHHFEWISLKPLAASILSIMIMLGIAFVEPNKATANYASMAGGVCSEGTGCQTTGCSGYETDSVHNFSPLVSASFSTSTFSN